MKITDDVAALVDVDGQKLEDICAETPSGDCFIGGILRYFGTTGNFNQSVQTQADLLQAVNAATFPDGGEAYGSDSMGGIQRVNGSISSASAIRVDFILWDEGFWGQSFLNHFVADDLTQQRYDLVNVYAMTSDSMDDELSRTVQVGLEKIRRDKRFGKC